MRFWVVQGGLRRLWRRKNGVYLREIFMVRSMHEFLKREAERNKLSPLAELVGRI